MERITSRQNPIVRRFRALARDAPGSSGPLLLDGEHLVHEALASRVRVELAACSERRLDSGASPLAQIADEISAAGGRVLAVPDEVLAAMSPVRQPSGIVAIAHLASIHLDDAFGCRDDAPPLVLVVAGLQDPGNVGALVRSAAAFGATAAVTTAGTAHPFGWKALRGAMGGTFRVPIAAGYPAAEIAAVARHAGVRIVAAVPRGGTPLPDTNLREATALVLGNEGAGLSGSLAEGAATRVTIPMRAPVESLNVAIAGALVLYEAWRQRVR